MSPEEKDAFDKQWKKLSMDPGPLLVPETMAVRTKDWKYITYPGTTETDELYDLKSDPYEMKNLISDPGQAERIKGMQARLAQLVKEME
jgi:arylsulfatase A-like enzyme